ncbi:outer membrane transport energization protein TonB [Pseudoxanthomonas sp. GM95]|uniref:energy transducer TonB n=1 Tax=Pseudoxanthomonas sp. GM95 TaxID=1881043 RepID=UPI0008AE12A5|nr:energy transducer TonB [Pseudoxanthomonas sp. GM95]SEL79369.1 outer membrane transport energization protein TonB [Pseudoxanthomonas sp. GM95]
MVRTLPYGPETGLNPARIAGISVAILVHAAAFLLLLIPAALPPIAQHLKDAKPEIVLIPKEKPIETPIAPKPQPRASKTEPRPVTPTPPIVQPKPVIVDTPMASLPTDLSPVVDPAPTAEPTIAPPAGPISASSLSYVRAPAPAYPRTAIMDHAEGTVILRVLVDVDGTPLEVIVETSSGNRELDRAARAQVLKNWKFQPATQDGRAVQAIGRVPVDFSLR